MVDDHYNDAPNVAEHAQVWLDTILAQKGNPCGNCGSWRLLDGREIKFCAICGDEAYDIYVLAENAQNLPATKGEVTKESLIADARRIIKNIDQMFIDVRHWNENTRPRPYPNDPPIDPDPDGQMARMRAAVQKTLDQLT